MIIKTSARQLSDGYLDRTPWFQYVLLSICFPMWAWLYAVFPRFAHGDLRRVFDGAVCDCGGAVVFGNVV